MFRAKLVNGNYAAVENVGDPINGPSAEVQVFVTPEDDMMIFAALGRADSQGSVMKNSSQNA